MITINIDDILKGKNEWVNIQSIIRSAFGLFYQKVEENSKKINNLESQLRKKTDETNMVIQLCLFIFS
jgi:uncharacterized membrane protein